MTKQGARGLLTVGVAGLIAALLGAGVGWYLAISSEPRYRAEMTLAMIPGPQVEVERISDYWEALSRGQASRIAAEVIDQPRWRSAAARVAGIPEGSFTTSTGVIADTSLISVGGEAPTEAGAAAAVTELVREATPVAESVAGPFSLQVVQSAEGATTLVSTPDSHLIGIAAAAGLVLGVGAALTALRRREARGAADPIGSRSPAQVDAAPRQRPVTSRPKDDFAPSGPGEAKPVPGALSAPRPVPSPRPRRGAPVPSGQRDVMHRDDLHREETGQHDMGLGGAVEETVQLTTNGRARPGR